MKAVLRWAVLSVAVWVAASIVPGIAYDDWQSLLVAALVLGVLNAAVKPVLQFISLPLIVLTLGLFLLVVNAVMLRLTSWLVTGFYVEGFWPAVGGSVVISVVSMVFGYDRRAGISRVDTLYVDRPGPRTRGPPPGRGDVIDV